MRPWSPPRAWSCRSTPAPHTSPRPTHPRRHGRTLPPTDRRHPPSGALRVRLQPHTPVRNPAGPYPQAEPGRPRTSSPGIEVRLVPHACQPHRHPTAAAGFGRQRRRPTHPSTAACPSTAATAANGYASGDARATTDAAAPRQRAYPVRDATAAAAAATAAAGGRRGHVSRRRRAGGVAVPAAVPRLPSPPPAAAAAPGRHDPSWPPAAAPAFFRRHHPPVEQTCPTVTPRSR